MSAPVLAALVVVVHVAHTLLGLPFEGLEQALIAAAQGATR